MPTNPTADLAGMKKEIENIQASIQAAAAAAAKAAPAAKEKTKRRPFGISLVEKTNTTYMFAILLIMLSMMWWMSLPHESLYGVDTQVKLVRVISGDTALVATTTGDVIPIRLRHMDAPEVGQHWGQEALDALERLCAGPNKELIVFIWDRENKHGYYVADLLVRKDVRTAVVHVQMHLVENGHAWHYGGFDKDGPMKKAMVSAREAKLGLWGASEEPMPPWKFRRLHESQHGKSKSGLNRREREDVDAYEKQKRPHGGDTFRAKREREREGRRGRDRDRRRY